MVTTTKDETFLTYDAGKTWKSLGFSAKTNGAKAVAVCNMPNSKGTPLLTVFMVHSIYGLGYIHPELASPKWVDITGGFENQPSISYPDEISDLLTIRKFDETTNQVVTELYLAQSYMPCIYRLNWETKRGELLGKDSEPLSTIESIFASGNKLVYVHPSGFGSFDLPTKTFDNNPDFTKEWKSIVSRVENTQCMYIPENASSFGQAVSLNELWLLEPDKIYSSYIDKIDGKKALYIPAGQATPGEDLQEFLDIMKENKLNTAVIDMKDDYGLLRYVSNDDFVNQKAVSSMYAIDLDAFVKQCKQDDIYLVARIVVFKDRNLWRYGGGKYAIKDAYSGKSWQGIRRYNDVLDENGNGVVINNPTGIQDSSALALQVDINGNELLPRIGTIAFSNDNQKGENYSDYRGSIVEKHVNNYEKYLKNIGIDLKETRLIKIEELEMLGCLKEETYCKNSIYKWVYSTSYWTYSSDVSFRVWSVLSNGKLLHDHYYYEWQYGVRPVIEILKSQF
mgnify:CR=1 FL=1